MHTNALEGRKLAQQKSFLEQEKLSVGASSTEFQYFYSNLGHNSIDQVAYTKDDKSKGEFTHTPIST